MDNCFDQACRGLIHRACLGATVGALAHNTIFIRGEWHLLAPHIFTLHLCLPFVLLALELIKNRLHLYESFIGALVQTCSYTVTLLLSIAIYRVCFHRLRHFPGPSFAKISKLWHVYNISDGKNHLFLEDLHKQYGEFVRTGPNELTVYHPNIHRLLDGPGNTCTKSAWYDVVHPDKSLVSARDKSVHDERRRLWFRGLGPSSIREYETRMLLHIDQLIGYYMKASQNGASVNVTDTFFWFCWDVMGDTTFGKSFGMLQGEKWHSSVEMLRRALSILGPVSPAPWAFHIAFKYLSNRWVVRDWETMKETCYKLVMERIQIRKPQKDLFESLITRATQKGFTETEMRFLNGDAVVGLVAGSDPVAATLVFLFSHLARDPNLQKNLHVKLAAHNIRDTNSLRSCQYLISLINETLRMYPPLMTGGMRDTGDSGLTVGNTYIPGNVTVISPRFSISRLRSCFDRPDEFLPERWTTSPELNINGKAFNPFGIGAHSCVGRNIVWSEVLLVTAALVTKFHVSFAPGEDGRLVYEDLRDYIAPAPGRLNLVFAPRS